MKISMLEALNISITGFVVVLIILALLACIIVVLSKLIQFSEPLMQKRAAKKAAKKAKKLAKKNGAQPAEVNKTDAVAKASAPVDEITGTELYRVDEKSAASIMAIVSHETGIPLERLNFKSIKLCDKTELIGVDDKTAAVVMAITSHQCGIPLERLAFKSIKLIEK